MIGEEDRMNQFQFIETYIERWNRRHYIKSPEAIKCIESKNGQ